MQNEAREKFEFNPDKLKKVEISKVRENDWNPKDPNDPEYEKVVRSIRINGLTQPIFVRQNDNGETKYEVLDGAHRLRACKELGFKEIYIYDEGEISDELAKTFTIWHQIQVPFETIELAPLVVELNRLDMELPYSDEEVNKFADMLEFSFNDYSTEEPDFNQEPEDEMKTLNIKMTPEQFEVVHNAIKTVSDGENVSEGRALELLCANGLNGYPFDGTGDIELEEES